MSADRAIGLAVNQQIFARGMQAQELATPLGLTKSSVSRKLRGNVSWSADEVLRTAMFFGIEPADLMPTPDGMGGWIPAPFKPARRRDVDALVPQVGLEPTTHGFAVVILLSALLIVRAFAHLPALPGAPALPIGPARLALSRLPAIRTGFPAFHSGGSVEYEHSTPCSGTARASRLGGAH